MHTSAAAALRRVLPGAVVVASPYCATPETLLRALGERAQQVGGLTLTAGMLLGSHPYADAVRAGRLALRSWHVNGPARALASDGLVDYVPCRASDVATVLDRGVDVALVRVGPPDRQGECSLGPSLSYTRAAVERAGLVIAEIDPAFPRVRGEQTTIPRERLDVLVEADTPTCTHQRAAAGPESPAITERVLELLPTGAMLQVGIGALPESVVSALQPGDGAVAGIVGLATDAMIPFLDRAGPAAAPAVRAVELMGTAGLFAAAHDNPALWMASSAVIHDPAWLAAQPRLVSLCSALEIDLSGQAASEAVGGRLVAGAGGSVDFMEGAHLSRDGLRVVALPSCTPRGDSRIVRRLAPDTPVTLPRHGIDVVVTEHGTAWLRGRGLAERAAALAAIAAPQHRAGLT